jgi:hypothetical protein
MKEEDTLDADAELSEQWLEEKEASEPIEESESSSLFKPQQSPSSESPRA